MSQFQGSSAKTAPGLAGAAVLLWALPALLGGCDAIYDDTKGWANRLEASILEAAHELDEDPDAQEAAHYTPEVVEAPRPPREAGGGGQPVTMAPQAAAAPQQQAMLAPAAAAPEGAVADAAGGLMAPAPEAKAETGAKAAEDGKKADAAAKNAVVKKNAKKPQTAEGKTAKAALPPLPKRKPQMAAAAPEKEAAKKPEEKAAQAPAQAAAKADNSHAMVLHLSSLRSEEAAKREWSNLKRDFPVALNGMEAQIRRTELGDKGTFYRILAGPLPSRTAAREACAEVKARNVKQYCRVLPSPPAPKSPS
jgi:cell division septation protein DedD